jgi:CRISPR-associated endonuclease Cas3-HD
MMYLAHYDGAELNKHLRDVGILSLKYANEVGLDNLNAELARFNGYLHDIGKYSSYFQNRDRNRKFRRHSLLSAVLAINIYRDMYGEPEYDEFHYVFLPIVCHHTRLKSLSSVLDNIEGNIYDLRGM